MAAALQAPTSSLADSSYFDDAKGDGPRGADIDWMYPEHSKRALYIRVKHHNLRKKVYGSSVFFIDTRRRNAGPEWRVVSNDSCCPVLSRVNNWRPKNGTERKCNVLLVDAHFEDGWDETTAWLPRRCIGDPKRVRINAVTITENGGSDHVPAPRRFPAKWLTAG